MKYNKFIQVFILVFIFYSGLIYADNIFIIIAQKEAEKKSRGWSLIEWLETKKKFALMDQWLALNTKPESLFEGIIGASQGEYRNYTNEENINREKYLKIRSANIGLFLSLIGIGGEYEKKQSSYSQTFFGSFMLLGAAQQSTNITLHYGLKEHYIKDGDTYRNQFYGASLSLYLFRFLGFDGHYREYLKNKSKLNVPIEGNLSEAGAFIDLFFLRITGTYFHEKIYIGADPKTREGTEGVKGGVKIFF